MSDREIDRVRIRVPQASIAFAYEPLHEVNPSM